MAEIDIIARLKLAGEGFNREFKQNLGRMEADAKASSNRIRSAFSGLKGLGAGLIAGIGVSTLTGLAKDAIEFADAIGDTSDRLGVGAEFLQKFRYAAVGFDASVESADEGLGKFNKTVGEALSGNKAASEAFDKLGVSLRNSSGEAKPLPDLYKEVANAISRLPSVYEKSAAVQKIFGRGAKELIPLLSAGAAGFEKWSAKAVAAGAVLSESELNEAGTLAKKLDLLNFQLKVDVTKAVIANAEQIRQLTSDLLRLASMALKALEAYQNFRNGLGTDNPNIPQLLKTSSGRQGLTEKFSDQSTRFRAEARLRSSTASLRGGFTDADRAFVADRERRAALQDKARASVLRLDKIKAVQDQVRASRLVSPEFNDDRLGRLGKGQKALDGVAGASGRAAKSQGALRDAISSVDEQLQESIPKFGQMAQEVEDLLAESARRVNEFYDKINIDPIADRKAIDDSIEARKQKEFDAIEEAAQHRYEVGRETEDRLASMYETLFTQGTGAVWKDFKAQGLRQIAAIAAQYTLALLSGQKVGGAGGIDGFFSNILGGGAPGAGPGGGGFQGIASSLGQMGGPISVGIALNQGLSKLLGNDQRKNGMALSLLVGPFLAAAIAKAKKGSATLGFSDGSLGVGSTRGNSKSRIEAASGGISAVSDNLQQIADALGGTITGAGSVSLGVRKKSYRVDTTGQGRTKGAGVLDFGKDEQAAIRAATLDALKDGVIGGISEASKRILAAGKDLQKSIEKASLIESIPKALKARLDPVGAAIDEVNDRWTKTIAALKEGGATAQQMADAQKLYNLELSDAKTVSNGARASLKEFLDGLKFGSSSPLDLRTQEASAKAALQPFLDQIQAGTLTDQAGYQQAAGAFLDIERQINGSTEAFFAEFSKIQAATAQAIASIDAAAPIRTPTTDLFAQATATATQQTATSNQAIANMSQQQLDQLAQIRALLASMNASGASGFIGAPRNFAFN